MSSGSSAVENALRPKRDGGSRKPKCAANSEIDSGKCSNAWARRAPALSGSILARTSGAELASTMRAASRSLSLPSRAVWCTARMRP